ncbi:MAG TPA: efflux RND transporter periplasmic adaptor subunit [Nannocystis sp.]
MKHALALLLCLLIPGCTRDVAEEHGDHAHPHAEEDPRPGLVFTKWDAHSELFVEFPALVVGQESRFAAHLTRLSDFGAVDSGTMTAELGDGAEALRAVADAPSRPGIFRPTLTPTRPGTFRLVLRYESPGLAGAHDLGEITVYPDTNAAVAAAPPGADLGGVPFLKEQQWQIPFATEPAAARSLRPSMAVYATLRARPDGEVSIHAPVAGRLGAGTGRFPQMGARITKDEVLAAIVPQLGQDSDRATLDLAVQQARIDVDNARIERERLESLLKAGAIPERRVIEARHSEREALALQTAASRRRGTFGRVQRTGGGAGDIAVRAPLSGTVVDVQTTPGSFVAAGQALLVAADLGRLWLEAHVPEHQASGLGKPAGAWFRVPGIDEVVEVGAEGLVTVAGRIDPETRTLPVVFAIDNPGERLPIGTFVEAHLVTGPPREALAVPTAAVLTEAGQAVVYVQPEGERFERRPVELGVQDGAWIEVVRGVAAGERVVSRGAYLVRLAGASGTVPTHGHAH